MPEVGHGDAHGVLKEGTGVVDIAVQVVLLSPQTRHVLLVRAIFSEQSIVFSLEHQNMLSLALSELLSSFSVAKDFCFGFWARFGYFRGRVASNHNETRTNRME